MKNQPLKKLINDLFDVTINENITLAKKANLKKIKFFFLNNEWRLTKTDKELINICITYITNIQEKQKLKN